MSDQLSPRVVKAMDALMEVYRPGSSKDLDQDNKVRMLLISLLRHEIRFYAGLDNSLSADLMVMIIDDIIAGLPMSTDEEVVRMAKSRFKLRTGEDFVGPSDAILGRLVSFLRVKQIMEAC